jgi:hypothetical protein
LALELDGPSKWFENARNRPKKGGFAGAVASQQGDKISLGNL